MGKVLGAQLILAEGVVEAEVVACVTTVQGTLTRAMGAQELGDKT